MSERRKVAVTGRAERALHPRAGPETTHAPDSAPPPYSQTLLTPPSTTSIKTTDFVGEPTKACLLMVPDIFGIHEFKQSCQVADRLVAAIPGLAVAHPNVFKDGEGPWSMSEFPPKDKAKFGAFIAAHPYEHVKGVMQEGFAALEAKAGGGDKASSLKRLTMGFCWGALMAVEANADAEMRIDGTAGAHPTFFGKEKELAPKLRAPVLLLPTKEDPVLESGAGGKGAEVRVRRFDDQVHGFMAARGDYKDEKVREAAGQGVGEVATFISSIVGESA